MRLIDEDEAIKRLGDAHFKNYGNAIMVIRETPTVDAEPVRHARLVNASPYGECSCCGALIDSRDRFRYCPYCGAMLDGEEHETD